MLASDVIKYAYREAALRPIGFTPTANETAEGLYRLNAFINSLFGFELGEDLADWSIPTSVRTASQDTSFINQGFPGNVSTFDQPGVPYDAGGDIAQYPPINSRILCRITSATTLYLPQFPADGARMAFVDNGMSATLTLDANGRKIASALTATLPAGTANTTWFYRSDLAEWQVLAQLTSSDQTPLPTEFDDLFVTGLAIRLTALDEVEPKTGTLEAYKRILTRCKQRYAQPGLMSGGGQNIPNSWQSYDDYWGTGRQW